MSITLDGTAGVVVSGNTNTLSGITVGRGAGSVATNTAVGASALGANTTGARNTATGVNALVLNTTGNYNFAAGSYAMASNVSGNSNTGVGDYALNVNTASNNTGVGQFALGSNTSGASNSGVGSGVLNNNTTGSYNTALGASALNSNTTASNNTAVGYQAGYANTTGASVTAFGYQAGKATVSVNSSTYIGSNSGLATTGAQNTFLGQGSGEAITSGAKNTVIGRYDGNTGGLDIRTASNYIVLSDGDGNPRMATNQVGQSNFYGTANVVAAGSGSAAGTTNRLFYGLYSATGPADGTLCYTVWTNGNVVNTNNSYGAISDIKLKENIEDATPKLAQLCQVRVVNYNFKEGQTQKQLGVIAQELEQVFPSMIEESPDVDKDGNDLGTTTKSVKYSVFVPMLIKAIQELKAEIDTLKGQA